MFFTYLLNGRNDLGEILCAYSSGFLDGLKLDPIGYAAIDTILILRRYEILQVDMCASFNIKICFFCPNL